jgi:hypothetical protein
MAAAAGKKAKHCISKEHKKGPSSNWSLQMWSHRVCNIMFHCLLCDKLSGRQLASKSGRCQLDKNESDVMEGKVVFNSTYKSSLRKACIEGMVQIKSF